MQLQWPQLDKQRVLRICWLVATFFLLLLGGFLFLRQGLVNEYADAASTLQLGLYAIGGGLLLAVIGVLFMHACMPSAASKPRAAWVCPVAAGILGLAVMSLAYVFLGVYPVGEKSVLIVDMHNQYAPLLSELRHILLEGGNFTYSFHVGLGANFISCFAYYLASPLNLLLVLFSESQLAEGILVITLIKNALCAAGFAACVQYIYRKRNAVTVALSVMYSLMLYLLAYSWNIMWLDGLLLLPVVVLCFERMMREGKWLAYVLSLALALFSSYYIGFMLCVFLVLYFVVWQLRSVRPLAGRLRGTAYFAVASLLGGGLAMALLVPTALSLGRTSAAGDAFPNFAANFDFFDLIGRFYYGASPTIRSGNLPNVYCGVLAALLVPIYATQRSIPLRRRLSFGALLAVLMVSCSINQWDLLWHGLHSPNDLPYRFSFLVCFVMLLMAAQVLTRLTQIRPKQIFGSLAAGAAYLFLWEKIGGDSAPEDTMLYVNLLLLTVYAAVLLLGATRRMPVRAGRLLLLLVVTCELLVGSGQTLSAMNRKEYFTPHVNYVDNTKTEANALAVQRAQEIAADAGELFARIEYLPRSTCMDTALHHYEGITTFASSNPYATTVFMGDLGYAVNGVNSYLYHSFVAPCDSLLGIRYVILNAELEGSAQLELVDSVVVGDQARYIYRNNTALPVGMFSTGALAAYTGQSYMPFDNQELLYSSILGEAVDLYQPLSLTAEAGATINGAPFSKGSETSVGVFAGAVKQPGQYFAYVDCRAASSIQVAVQDTVGAEKNTWSVTTHEPYILDLGRLTAGETVEVSVSADTAVSGNIHVVRLDADVLAAATAVMREQGLTLTERKDTSLSGTLTAPQDGMVFYSIPYDEGWHATVDGQPAKTVAVDKNEDGTDGAMLAVEVPAGEHTVVIRYRAPGQITGLVLSLVSAAAVVVWWVLERRGRRKTALASAEKTEE